MYIRTQSFLKLNTELHFVDKIVFYR